MTKKCIVCGSPLSLQTDTCYNCRKKAIHDDKLALVEQGIIDEQDLYVDDDEVKKTDERP